MYSNNLRGINNFSNKLSEKSTGKGTLKKVNFVPMRYMHVILFKELATIWIKRKFCFTPTIILWSKYISSLISCISFGVNRKLFLVQSGVFYSFLQFFTPWSRFGKWCHFGGWSRFGPFFSGGAVLAPLFLSATICKVVDELARATIQKVCMNLLTSHPCLSLFPIF